MIAPKENIEILKLILNPICLHCSALSYTCRGLNIRQWNKAKNCQDWKYDSSASCRLDKLYVVDYLEREISEILPTAPLKNAEVFEGLETEINTL